eukprot:m.60719 g.60719  ORF g.60719 m.60719 type:complete len:522 (+) comp7960_c1_seq1:397-1962(+)
MSTTTLSVGGCSYPMFISLFAVLFVTQCMFYCETNATGLKSDISATATAGASTTVPITDGCSADDMYEPNDGFASATVLETMTTSDLFICPSNEDVFHFTVCEGGTLSINVLFQHQQGDLDCNLLDSTLASVAQGTSSTDNEHVFASGDISYYLVVFGYGSDSNSYTLQYNVNCNPTTIAPTTIAPTTLAPPTTTPPCAGDDDFEQNDSAGSATIVDVSTISTSKLFLCPGDKDVFKISVCNPGKKMDVTINFVNQDGNLDLYLYNSNLDIIDSSTSEADKEEVSMKTTLNTYYVNVVGSSVIMAGAYTLRVCGTGCNGEPTSCDPCDGTASVKNAKKCKQYCGSDPHKFYGDASTIPNSPFPNCHENHCQCYPGPCDGIVEKKSSRACKKYCGTSNYVFFPHAVDAGFRGCSKKHCECGGTPAPNPCVGTTFKKKASQCRSYCHSSNQDSIFYTHASDSGILQFQNCDEKHCECVSDPCAGTVSWSERKCKKKCPNGYTFYNDAEQAGFTGCHKSHCDCM